MLGAVAQKDRYSVLSPELQKIEIQKRTELLLKARERSSHELRDRLTRLGFSAIVIEAEIERVTRSGIVDDERFMQLFVAGKKRCGWGQMRIERELKHFGIDIRSSKEYPDAFFDVDEELERAVASIWSFKSSAKDKYSAYWRKLVYKGYAPDIVSRAIPLCMAFNEALNDDNNS